MEVLLLLIRILLFAVFAAAGFGKLLDPDGSERALTGFGVPAGAAKPLAVGLPVFELLLAMMLIPVTTSWVAAIGAFLLLAAFIGGMILQIAQGNAPDCHCFGAIHSEPVGKSSVIRNIIFALLAFTLVAAGAGDQGLSLSDLTEDMVLELILGLTVIALLGAALFYLRGISGQQELIIRRIELLEAILHDGGREVERKQAGHPHDGLPIGAPAPDFALPGLDGRIVSFESLLARVRPMLFFFVSPTCMPCRALVPELEKWRDELRERVDFVIVTSGEASENEEKFGQDRVGITLLQKEREVAELFMAKWTPAAVFVNSHGNVASHVAAGDAAIRTLVDGIRGADLTDRFAYFTPANRTSAVRPMIGEKIPEFSLEDVSGRPITRADLVGKPTLVAFWSTTCPHCIAMIRDLRNWDGEKGEDEPNLLVFSSGDPEEHRQFGLKSPIVLDTDYKTAEKFGMFGTPSAVLVDGEGVIVSETAIGAHSIWALIGKRK